VRERRIGGMCMSAQKLADSWFFLCWLSFPSSPPIPLPSIIIEGFSQPNSFLFCLIGILFFDIYAFDFLFSIHS